MVTRAPLAEKLKGLTFKTLQELPVAGADLISAEKRKMWHRINVILSIILALTVFCLWYIFR